MVQEFVRVDVSDTGPGMSEDVRSRLFEKFAQGSDHRRSSGVGLGLYISREIVVRHGGTIWVESELGRGSTFSLRIPVVR
jgi:signal transduction histidine kinase